MNLWYLFKTCYEKYYVKTPVCLKINIFHFSISLVILPGLRIFSFFFNFFFSFFRKFFIFQLVIVPGLRMRVLVLFPLSEFDGRSPCDSGDQDVHEQVIAGTGTGDGTVQRWGQVVPVQVLVVPVVQSCAGQNQGKGVAPGTGIMVLAGLLKKRVMVLNRWNNGTGRFAEKKGNGT